MVYGAVEVFGAATAPHKHHYHMWDLMVVALPITLRCNAAAHRSVTLDKKWWEPSTLTPHPVAPETGTLFCRNFVYLNSAIVQFAMALQQNRQH